MQGEGEGEGEVFPGVFDNILAHFNFLYVTIGSENKTVDLETTSW